MKSLAASTDEERAVVMLRALANPARFRIVRLLAESDASVCGDLVGRLPLAQSTVSEHLRVLREAGIVQGGLQGPASRYCLVPDALAWLRTQLASPEAATLVQGSAGEGHAPN